MKKSIIALMGLFTLVACSDESYQEADKMNETGTVENGSGSQNSIKTVGPFYNSPYFDNANNLFNYGTIMEYNNSSPLTLNLVAYGGDLHRQTVTTFNPIPSQTITSPPFSLYYSSDCAGIFNTIAGGCYSPASLSCDFGSPAANTFLLQNGKIHYFYYQIYNGSAFVTDGYLKQRFFNDGDLHSNITAMDGDWQYLSTVPSLPGSFDAVAMYSVTQDEICIAQDAGMTAVLPSSVQVIHPVTGVTYTLEYYTNGNPNGIFVTFN